MGAYTACQFFSTTFSPTCWSRWVTCSQETYPIRDSIQTVCLNRKSNSIKIMCFRRTFSPYFFRRFPLIPFIILAGLHQSISLELDNSAAAAPYQTLHSSFLFKCNAQRSPNIYLFVPNAIPCSIHQHGTSDGCELGSHRSRMKNSPKITNI